MKSPSRPMTRLMIFCCGFLGDLQWRQRRLVRVCAHVCLHPDAVKDLHKIMMLHIFGLISVKLHIREKGGRAGWDRKVFFFQLQLAAWWLNQDQHLKTSTTNTQTEQGRVYSQNGDDVASLDLVVPHAPAVQQHNVTAVPALWVKEGLQARTHSHQQSALLDMSLLVVMLK